MSMILEKIWWEILVRLLVMLVIGIPHGPGLLLDRRVGDLVDGQVELEDCRIIFLMVEVPLVIKAGIKEVKTLWILIIEVLFNLFMEQMIKLAVM